MARCTRLIRITITYVEYMMTETYVAVDARACMSIGRTLAVQERKKTTYAIGFATNLVGDWSITVDFKNDLRA